MMSPKSSTEPVKPILGPFDKRKTLTRCQSCARRKIKVSYQIRYPSNHQKPSIAKANMSCLAKLQCQGPFPCAYCVRTNKLCQPLRQESIPTVKFVTTKAPVLCQKSPLTRLRPQPLSFLNDSSELVYTSHFASFMTECQFTRSFSGTTLGSDLLPLMHDSPPLRSLILAIGALQSSRRATIRIVNRQHQPQSRAYKFYAEAIQEMKYRLQRPDVSASDDILWATFLLGLFELLTEASGVPWATHMLYGTARLFQIAGAASARATELKGRLFDAFCILESKRALLFGDDTFLSRGEWLVPQQRLDSPQLDDTDHLLRLLPLIHKVSAFSQRLFGQVEAVPETLRPDHATISSLAHEGVAVHGQLNHQILATQPYPGGEDDVYYLLAKAFLYSMSLFHCRNFQFYSCWGQHPIPSLLPGEISTHCSITLTICSRIVNERSGVPGVILMFPLRMVGVHVADSCTRNQVLKILAQIRQQGFVVADRIRLDLEEVWKLYDEVSPIVED